MKIYGDVISPFVRMTLVTAHEVGLGDKVDHVVEPVKPTEVNHKLAALNPIGKIPVLETDHGHAVYDSRVIMEYLCHVGGNSVLIPDDGVKRFRVLTLQALGVGLADSAVAYRYETAARPQGLQWEDWMARTVTRINASLDDLEKNWEACLAEAHVGSIAAAVTLSYLDFRLGALNWREGRTRLARFHEDFSARDSMVRTKLG
ncbi:MAG TPA: glutathione S-transferase N-terminal domain-containing protein [Aestuariivirga sp.]|nr:glutathione S-transferase N-terminal domain-containing protein [Aestuariivirga sp.]